MTDSSRNPLQQLNDYLLRQVDVVGQQGYNKRIHCKKCKQNFTGHAGRIHDHLIPRSPDLAPQRAEDLVYVHFNRRCVLKCREPEQFVAWLDEDVQLLPVEGE